MSFHIGIYLILLFIICLLAIFIINKGTNNESKILYHGSAFKFDIGEPRLTIRENIWDNGKLERIKYKGNSFHTATERYMALSYLYNKKDNRDIDIGVSLSNKNYKVIIYGKTNLKDSLKKLYGKGGYLYEFKNDEWFVWFHGIGDYERLTFNKVKPIKRTFIKDPVTEMKKEGVEFVFIKK